MTLNFSEQIVAHVDVNGPLPVKGQAVLLGSAAARMRHAGYVAEPQWIGACLFLFTFLNDR